MLGMPGQAIGQPATIQIGSMETNQLPDRPAGYEGVDVLVLRDLAPGFLPPKVQKALSMWVASGGTLVVSAGPNYRNYQNEFYDDLLPVSVSGATNMPSLGSLSSVGKTPFPAVAVSVANSTVKPGIGRSILTESGVPIRVDRQYGVGRVVYLAFDCQSSPFKDWNGQISFWKRIISSRQNVPLAPASGVSYDTSQNYYYNSMMSQANVASAVQQNPSIKMPTFNVIAMFMLAYVLLLVPINYSILKRKRRLELAWVTTPAIIVVFTVVAYGIGHTMKGGTLRLEEATVIEGASDTRYARTLTTASIFSPARRSYSLATSDPFSLVQVLNSEPTETPEVYAGEQQTIDSLPMAMWSSRTFESTSGMDLEGGIGARLVSDGVRLQGTVSNNMGVDLIDCRIVKGRHLVHVSSIGRGRTVNISAAFDTSATPVNPVYQVPNAGLRQRVGQLLEAGAASSGVPILIARAADSPQVFRFTGAHPSTVRETFYVFRLGSSMGKRFAILPDSIASKGMDIQGAQPQRPDGSRYVTGGTWYASGSMLISYALVIPSGCEATSLTLHISAPKSNGGKVGVSVLNWRTGAWEPVGNGPEEAIASPAAHISEDGEVRVKLVATKGRGGNPISASVTISADGRRK